MAEAVAGSSFELVVAFGLGLTGVSLKPEQKLAVQAIYVPFCVSVSSIWLWQEPVLPGPSLLGGLQVWSSRQVLSEA